MPTRHPALLAGFALSALCLAAGGASAQGKGRGKEQKETPATHHASKHETAKTSERRVVVRDTRRVVRTEPARPVHVERVRVVERDKPAHGRKVVTTDRAIVVTREVLVKHGYEVVRVETVRGARVVYYRRGNMGRGRGKGPIVKMVIRPAQERVVFEQAPHGLLAEINGRLGM